MKKHALAVLNWLFDRDPLGPAVLVWVYTIIWCLTVLAFNTREPVTTVARLYVGLLPNSWCAVVFIAASYQLVCCRYFNCIWGMRFIVSIITASFVIYTVVMPIIQVWITYRLFFTLSSGSVVVAIASLLVVARCMRMRKCQEQKLQT